MTTTEEIVSKSLFQIKAFFCPSTYLSSCRRVNGLPGGPDINELLEGDVGLVIPAALFAPLVPPPPRSGFAIRPNGTDVLADFCAAWANPDVDHSVQLVPH